MRVSIDTNVLVSYLLAPRPNSVPHTIVSAALDQRFDAVISEDTLQELVRVARDNAYLADRIDPDQVRELIALFVEMGIVSPAGPTPQLSGVRDPNDEYLVDHAAAAEVDYLVTGDRDLLELEHDFGFQIVTPAEFLDLLEGATDR